MKGVCRKNSAVASLGLCIALQLAVLGVPKGDTFFAQIDEITARVQEFASNAVHVPPGERVHLQDQADASELLSELHTIADEFTGVEADELSDTAAKKFDQVTQCLVVMQNIFAGEPIYHRPVIE